MSKYNFDQIIDRRGTHCKRLENLTANYGREDLLPLWIADMDFAVCPAITEALVERFAGHPVYGYTRTYDAFWQSIIDWQRERNGFVFGRDEVTFSPGGVTAFTAAVDVFTRPGDKVLIQPPVYYDFHEVLAGMGRQTVCNNLVETPDGFYTMDLDELEWLFKLHRPRMMVLCNPQNPVGIVWSPDVLRQVARLAREHGVVLFSDEVFGDIMLYGNRHTPLATVSDEAAAVTVTIGSPGKTFNIAGFKSAWVVVKDPELRRMLFHWIEVNEVNTSNIAAMTATEAAYRHGGQWLDECLRYIEGNIDYIVDYCGRNIPGVRAVRPQASFLVWLDFRGLGLSHEAVVDLVVNKARLALNDGAIYGSPGHCHMRLNAGSPRAVIVEAMRRLAAAVASIR